jgi:hypothetical protein
MFKKLYKKGLLIGIIILLIGVTIASGLSSGGKISIKYIKEPTEIIDEIDDKGNYSFGNYFFVTTGPISKLFTKATVTDGPFLISILINRNLKRRFIRLSAFLPKMHYPVLRGINFTIEYKRNVNNFSRFYFSTFFGKILYDENGSFVGLDFRNATTIICKKHKINVENFRVLFSFKGLQLISIRAALGQKIFNPARFEFSGFCDNVTIT